MNIRGIALCLFKPTQLTLDVETGLKSSSLPPPLPAYIFDGCHTWNRRQQRTFSILPLTQPLSCRVFGESFSSGFMKTYYTLPSLTLTAFSRQMINKFAERRWTALRLSLTGWIKVCEVRASASCSSNTPQLFTAGLNHHEPTLTCWSSTSCSFICTALFLIQLLQNVTGGLQMLQSHEIYSTGQTKTSNKV